MNENKFLAFLEDEAIYRECEAYWDTIIADIAAQSGASGTWIPYGQHTWGNNQPILDGNPIAAVWHKLSAKGIRVIQYGLTDDKGKISAWMVQDDIEPTLPQYELVISLSLTERTAGVARELMRRWMMRETDVTAMRAFIDELVV